LTLREGEAHRSRLTRSAILAAGFLVCLLLVWWMITRFTQLSG